MPRKKIPLEVGCKERRRRRRENQCDGSEMCLKGPGADGDTGKLKMRGNRPHPAPRFSPLLQDSESPFRQLLAQSQRWMGLWQEVGGETYFSL